MIPLDFGYVYIIIYNAKKLLIYLHDVNEYVRLRGDRISEICFYCPQHGTKIERLLL